MCKKADVLDAGGYVFDYHHGTYVNVPKKILFSHQFVDAKSTEELEAHVTSAAPTGTWQFFCLKPLEPAIQKKLEARYG